jgi:hypothetical protein
VPDAKIGHSHRFQPFFRSSNSLVRASSLCPDLHVRRWRRYTVSMTVFYTWFAELCREKAWFGAILLKD